MSFSRSVWPAERSLIHQYKAQSFVCKLCTQHFLLAFTVCLVLRVEWTYFIWCNIPHALAESRGAAPATSTQALGHMLYDYNWTRTSILWYSCKHLVNKNFSCYTFCALRTHTFSWDATLHFSQLLSLRDYDWRVHSYPGFLCLISLSRLQGRGGPTRYFYLFFIYTFNDIHT